MTTKTVLTAIAAFAAMAVSSGAFGAPASPGADVVSVKIALAGVKLQSPAGAEVALGRIHQAARQICGGEADGRDIYSRTLFQSCEKTTVDRAVKALGSPMVSALNGGALAVVEVASRGE